MKRQLHRLQFFVVFYYILCTTRLFTLALKQAVNDKIKLSYIFLQIIIWYRENTL